MLQRGPQVLLPHHRLYHFPHLHLLLYQGTSVIVITIQFADGNYSWLLHNASFYDAVGLTITAAGP